MPRSSPPLELPGLFGLLGSGVVGWGLPGGMITGVVFGPLTGDWGLRVSVLYVTGFTALPPWPNETLEPAFTGVPWPMVPLKITLPSWT